MRIKEQRKKRGQTGTKEKFYNSNNINLSNLLCLCASVSVCECVSEGGQPGSTKKDLCGT